MPAWLISFFTHPIVLLMIGGGVGTNARYWLGQLIVLVQGKGIRFPWATFMINVSGSIILGWAAATYLHQKDFTHPDPIKQKWYLLLGTGFCGGFTTFSTFSYETLLMIQEEKTWMAVLYVLGSVGGGLLGVWLAVKSAGS
jgi:fluoride exporter